MGNAKILKGGLDKTAVAELLNDQEMVYAMDDMAEKIAKTLDSKSPAAGGWFVKIHKRPKRTVAVVYTEDEKVRFREAISGNLRGWFRSKLKKGNIPLRKTPNGYIPMEQGDSL